MRIVTSLLVTTAVLAATVVVFGKDAAPAGRVAKPEPTPAIRKSGFTLRVQSKPRFGGQSSGAISSPTSDRGLSITIQPEKTAFPLNGPVSLKVVLKNKTERPLILPAASTLGGAPKLVLANQKTAAQWTVSGKSAGGKPESIKPGESKTLYLIVESRFVRVQPIPARGAKPAAQLDKLAAQPGAIIGRPRPPVVVNPNLPVGPGPIRARLFLEFSPPKDAARKAAGLWTGKLVSDPVDFEISRPVAVPFPVRRGGQEPGIRE